MNSTLRTLSLFVTLASTLCCGQMWGMGSGRQVSDQEKKQWEQDLIQAVRENKKRLVKDLLADQKGDINAYDENGWTALYFAIERGSLIEIVWRLLKAGANPNIPTNEVFYRYPIHAAINRDRVGTLHLLVNHGANINATDPSGKTPFALALQLNNAKCIKFLREHGAKVIAR